MEKNAGLAPDVMQHHRPWYSARQVQGPILLALLVLLVVIFAGPHPKLKSDQQNDSSVEADGSESSSAITKAAFSAQHSTWSGGAAGQVEVGFYGESLCPDCQHMVQDVLQPLFDNKVADLMNLTYYAFGKALNGTDGGYIYQHGSLEGKYNRYILCAQHFHCKQRDWFPYVKCLADNMHSLDAKADDCATGQGWEAAEISGCAEGPKGREIEAKAAAATWALHPDKSFVPWILVNGVAIGSDFENLERYVCVAAPAAARLDACYQLPKRLQSMVRPRSSLLAAGWLVIAVLAACGAALLYEAWVAFGHQPAAAVGAMD